MDPLTQGALGAALPQATLKNAAHVRYAGGLGFLGGMAADLDVLIRSNTDTLLFLEYHRQFTHSLIFIPVGALICAAALHTILGKRWQLTFLQTFLYCALGYATHALLDAMTSYGTMLLWPFSNARIAWNVISIIDPLFTVPLLVLVIIATRRKNPLYARLGLLWGALYLGLGLWQNTIATRMGHELAEQRGITPLRLEAKPSFGNLWVWKVITETQHAFFVDAVRTGPFPRVFPGAALPKLNLNRDFPWLHPLSQQAKDVERFRFFSQGYVAVDPTRPNQIMDARYSFVPNEVSPLWSIEISPTASLTDHARYVTHRENAPADIGRLWQMMTK